MARQLFVNLPVKHLARSVEFFTKLGFTFDPKFTDDNASCMIVGENIFVMLLVEEFFQTFTSKDICDTSKSAEVLVCMSLESRESVATMVGKAVAAVGVAPKESKDYGFMYQHGFQDLDGHLWELIHMEPNAATND